jgi:AcrR family transcriptional regulator
MRVKTDERRQAIMTAAAELFRETGYERASMAAISARVGGSKTTLYSYFKSKEELFATVMLETRQDSADRLFDRLDASSDDLESTVLHFARGLIELVLNPDIMAFIRIGMAECDNSGLGPRLYELGPKRGLERMAAFIDREIKAGHLRSADPWLAALHLKAILEAGIMEPSLYGTALVVDRDLAIQEGVKTFLRAYAPEPGGQTV